MLRHTVTRVGLAAAANFGIDPPLARFSSGLALRTAVATFGVLSTVLERIAVWMVLRAYALAVWTVRALVSVLDWVGATY